MKYIKFPLNFLKTLLSLLLLLVLTPPCSGLIFSRIGKKENFTMTTNDFSYDINMTLISVNHMYLIEEKYSFSVPEVNEICECSCDGNYRNCSANTIKFHTSCAYLNVSTKTCTEFNDEGVNKEICPIKYSICCQVYFTNASIFGNQIAMKLKYDKILYTFETDIKNGLTQQYEHLNFTLTNDMNGIQLNPNVFIEISVISESGVIEEGWYYANEKSLDLLKNPHINDKFSYDLQNIGWFRPTGSEITPRIPLQKLKEYLKIQPKTCNTSPSYVWNFNGTYYYRHEKFVLPEDVVRMMEKFNISESSVDLLKNIVLIKTKTIPKISVAPTNINFFQSSNFTVTTKKNNVENNYILFQFNFTKGFGDCKVEIFSSFLESSSHSFLLKIDKNISAGQHSIYNYSLDLEVKDSLWVCVVQEKKFCQLIRSTLSLNTSYTSSDSAFTSTVYYLLNDTVLICTIGFFLAISACIGGIIMERRFHIVSRIKKCCNLKENPDKTLNEVVDGCSKVTENVDTSIKMDTNQNSCI